jgi:rubredoxin
MMPIRYRCRHCGYVLYEFKGVGQSYIGAPSPLEVIKLVGHICPSCKRVLELPRNSFKDYIMIRTMMPSTPSIRYRHLEPVEVNAAKT